MARAKTLKDTQGNVVYPVNKASNTYMSDNATSVEDMFPIGTNDIKDKAVTADKIDFETFPGVQVFGVTVDASLSVTPEYDGFMVAFAKVDDCWGMNGGMVTLSLGADSGHMGNQTAQCNGGNLVGRFLQASCFASCEKGKTVTLTSTLTNAGGFSNRHIWGYIIPFFGLKKEKTAKAILGENGNLNFVYDSNTYNVGDTYTDNLGETVIKGVYALPDEARDWSEYHNDITSANFTSDFNLFKPTDTVHWFLFCNFLGPITGLKNLNTSNVVSMYGMFSGVGQFVETPVSPVSLKGIETWDTSKVTDMSGMFAAAWEHFVVTDVDLSTWDTSNVTNMANMFEYFGGGNVSVGDLSNWDTSKVTNMSYMFNGVSGQDIDSIKNWDVSNVTGMQGMFYDTDKLSLDLSGWDTSNVTDMSSMFSNASKLKTVYVGDGWNTDKVEESLGMFDDATSLVGGSGTAWNASNPTDKTYAHVDGGTDNPGYFTKLAEPTAKAILGENGNLNFVYDNNTYAVGDTYTDNLGETTISAVYDVPLEAGIFSRPGWSGSASNMREDITSVNFAENFHNFKPLKILCWFYYDGYVSSITNAQNLNTSNVTDMTQAFYYTGYNSSTFSLEGINNWDTSNVTNMSYMFADTGRNATTWNIGDLSNWDTGEVTNMSNMFSDAGRKATTWSIGNISNWNVSNVISMNSMFQYTGFQAVNEFSIDLSNWDTRNVTDMGYMFDSSAASSLDLSSWDTSNVTRMETMFHYTVKLETVYVGDGWNTDKVTDSSDMFVNATSLVGGAGTTYSEGNPTDKTYAHIDGGTSNPGYFT